MTKPKSSESIRHIDKEQAEKGRDGKGVLPEYGYQEEEDGHVSGANRT